MMLDTPVGERKGIASRFLKRVFQDAIQDGFDFVEAYPNKEFTNDIDFTEPIEMYKKYGFTVCHETEQKLVVRKILK